MQQNILKVMMDGIEVGKLYWNDSLGAAVFTYNPAFVSRGLDIAPLTASIHGPYGQGAPVIGVPVNKDRWLKGLPSFLADSLPDKWGSTLFCKWAETSGMDLKRITPVDQLSFVGDRAMGAFRFIPDSYPWQDNSNLQLGKLYELADKIYSLRHDAVICSEEEGTLAGLFEIGTSAGGQHPKAVIAIHNTSGVIRSGQVDHGGDYTHYLLKFAEGVDFPLANIEYAYYLMARGAGISMMPTRLYEAGGKQHFLTARYDRADGRRIHTQTLAAMNPDADSYEDLFDVAHKLQIPAEEKCELFRRTVFNLLAANTDDHNRNFSFMMTPDGRWHITPAYDLMFTADLSDRVAGGFHSLSLGGKECNFNERDLLLFARWHDIKRAGEVIHSVCKAIAGWYGFARQAGVPDFANERIEQYLSRLLPERYAADMNHHQKRTHTVRFG